MRRNHRSSGTWIPLSLTTEIRLGVFKGFLTNSGRIAMCLFLLVVHHSEDQLVLTPGDLPTVFAPISGVTNVMFPFFSGVGSPSGTYSIRPFCEHREVEKTRYLQPSDELHLVRRDPSRSRDFPRRTCVIFSHQCHPVRDDCRWYRCFDKVGSVVDSPQAKLIE